MALSAQGDATASSKSGKTDVTVTGCVAAGTQAGHFVLTDAATVPVQTPSPTGTSGGAVADAPAAMASPTSYDLKGGNLKPHIGHKVEVTGTTWQNAAEHGAKATTARPGDRGNAADAERGRCSRDLDARRHARSQVREDALDELFLVS